MEKRTSVGLHTDCYLANTSKRRAHFYGGDLGIIEFSASCVIDATDEAKFGFLGLANGVLLALLLSRTARSLAFADDTSLDIEVDEFMVLRILISIGTALKVLTLSGVVDFGKVAFCGGN